MDSLSRFALQIAFRSCPCNESKKDCSGEHGKVELFNINLIGRAQPASGFLSAKLRFWPKAAQRQKKTKPQKKACRFRRRKNSRALSAFGRSFSFIL
ncbi:hypothetical protein C3V36_04625 [Lachnospiraceae bacterium oral taxon 500]|nr:hypothetical protein C3V36_04625 [Lachnospiraceae bacterium oral taxon 500]